VFRLAGIQGLISDEIGFNKSLINHSKLLSEDQAVISASVTDLMARVF
jgi:hypothetical protein